MRLAFFVGLPTLIAGWYYFTQATPLYATNSQFMIQQAEGVPGVAGASITAGGTLLTSGQCQCGAWSLSISLARTPSLNSG